MATAIPKLPALDFGGGSGTSSRCTTPRSSRGSSRGRRGSARKRPGSGKKCFKCGEFGHSGDECPIATSGPRVTITEHRPTPPSSSASSRSARSATHLPVRPGQIAPPREVMLGPKERKFRARARRTAQQAHVVLVDPTAGKPADRKRVAAELTALIEDDTTKVALKTTAPLLTYRSLAFAQQDKNELALQDVMDILDDQPKNTLALRMQAEYQLKRAETMTATTGRYVEPAKTLYEFLEICPAERLVLKQFDATVDDVQRDRPFAKWWQQKTEFDIPMKEDEEKPRLASHWDYVLERVQDLFVDDVPQDDGTVKHGKDHSETRDLLLGNIDMILSVYDYYVRLGVHTETKRDKLEIERKEVQAQITQKYGKYEKGGMDPDEDLDDDPPEEYEDLKERLGKIMRAMEDTTWVFHKVEPRTIDLEHMDQRAMETFQRMFMDKADEDLIANGKALRDVKGDDGLVDVVEIDTTGDGKADVVGYDTTGDGKIDSYDTTGDGVIDTKAETHHTNVEAAIPVDRPDTLINLRQFRQLCLDCKLLCNTCQMADVGRLFLHSSREDTTTEAGGYELSEVDEKNPHFGGNSNHVYEYVEALIRVSHAIWFSNRKDGSQTLHGCFSRLIGDHLLPFSCSHETMDNTRWLLLSAKIQHVIRRFKSSLEQVFRFFAVDKANQAAVMNEDMAEQQKQKNKGSDPSKTSKQVEFHAFWKVRSLKMLDDTMSFKELYYMLDTLQLIDSELTPKKAAQLYSTVTCDMQVSPEPKAKMNQNTELVLDEFVELIARLAVMNTGGLNGGKKAEAIEERVEAWLLNEFLERAAMCMPKSTVKQWTNMQAAHGGDESSDSEEETEVVIARKKRLASGRVLVAEDRRGDGVADKVLIDSTGDGKADIVGFDTTGDGQIDSYDTNMCAPAPQPLSPDVCTCSFCTPGFLPSALAPDSVLVAFRCRAMMISGYSRDGKIDSYDTTGDGHIDDVSSAHHR